MFVCAVLHLRLAKKGGDITVLIFYMSVVNYKYNLIIIKKIMLEKTNEKSYQLKSNMPPCLIKGCEKDTYGGSRGLCVGHFSIMSVRVKNKITTWEELERSGLARGRFTVEEKRLRKEINSNLKRAWSPELRRFIFLKISESGETFYPDDLIQAEAEFVKKREKRSKVCILDYCNCPVKGGGHGLCKVHYRENNRRVKIGFTTWEALERDGLARNHGKN